MDASEREDPSSGKPFLMILVKQATIFFFAICAISIFFWAVGSESAFLDETQSMLLNIVRASSLAVVVASGFGILLAIAMAIGRRFGLSILGLLGYAVAGAIGIGALALAQSVLMLSRGLR